MINVELLKEVLAVPTKSMMESQMVAWLVRYCVQRHLRCEVDSIGNVYVTKGRLRGEYDFYPCVAAHTDSVHDPKPVQVVEDDGKLIALDADMRQCGLGGDDKAGVFICLQLLDAFPKIKAAFFVAEEIGCRGSRQCDESFFDDVGYLMEFDSPCDTIMTYTCDGTQLFPDSGPFADTMIPIVLGHGVDKWQHHPYTDASILKRKFDFPCLNLPGGYFRMHSSEEYVEISAVKNSVALGEDLINALGTRHYRYVAKENSPPGKPCVEVTGLRCHG